METEEITSEETTEATETAETTVDETTDAVEAPVEPRMGDPVDEPSVEPSAEPEGAETTETAEPEVPTISPEFVKRADFYGLNAGDLEGINEGQLTKIFASIDRRSMGDPQQAPTEPAQAASAQQLPEYQPFKMELDAEMDESFSGPYGKFADHMNAQFKELHSFRQLVVTELQAVNTIRELAEVDSFVSALGDAWVDSYGTGAMAHMDPQSPQYKNRLEIYRGAGRMIQDGRSGHLSPPDALLRSHRAKFVDKIVETETQKRVDKSAARKTQMSDRPSKGKAPTKDPRQQAVEAMRS